MRPLFFLVADKNMEFMIRGFFERDGWDKAVGCTPFDMESSDIVPAVGRNDPGLYAQADTLLSPYRGRYRHVVVMVDAAWEGSPGASAISARLDEHIQRAGWRGGMGLGLVLDPELEQWVWSTSPHVARILGWSSTEALETALVDSGRLVRGDHKPKDPKEAMEWALRRARKPRSSALYQKVACRVSLRRCADPALACLLDRLRAWFPLV